MKDQFSAAIADRKTIVGVVGLGYVGLPLAVSFVRAGFAVVGFDVDQSKIDMLDRGEPYLDHLGESLFDELAKSELFSSTTDMAKLGEVDAILVAVPTPLGTHNEPDLSYVQATARTIAKTARPGQLVALESTTYPGTTRDEFAPIIAEANPSLQFGTDYFIAYSPEREDPGRDIETSAVPKLVGGLDDTSGSLAAELYSAAFLSIQKVESAEVAEAAKVLENVFRAVNIALVNELKIILDRLDIDVWDVINAASTKPYGFMRFTPGPGLGGHCIPIDPFYLTWKAREVGLSTQFIELSGLINTSMPAFVVDKTAQALNGKQTAMSVSKILVVGLAYKPNVGDVRESPSFEVIEQLLARGASVDYHDPYVEETWPMRHYNLELASVELTAESVSSYDAVVIVTDHANIDYQMLADNAKIIVDTRNAMDGYKVVGQLTKA